MSKDQRQEEGVEDRDKSRTGDQYTSWYFTGRWIGLRLIGFSFAITTPTIGYSGDSEWVLDTGATYHVCPNRDCFSIFEKLDGCFAIMGDDHPCEVEGIGTIRIKMFDRMVRELKEVRYVPQVKMNLLVP